jgi:hypothetical protein
MRALALLGLLIMSLGVGGAAICSQNTAPQFDPDWNNGDTWIVQFTVPLPRTHKVGPSLAPPPEFADYVYQYSVLPDTQDSNFPSVSIAKILVHSEDNLGDWILTFDRDGVVLLSVEEVVGAAENIRHVSTFTDESWMAKSNQYPGILHDFPKITGIAGTRLIQPTLSGTPGFLQTESFPGASTAQVELTRTDAFTSLEHRTTILWDAGAKWWRSATRESGDGNVQVSAVSQVEVPVDIKPQSCPNSFNRKSHGMLPVAVVGEADFDVMMIDVSSILLSRADGVGDSVAPNEGPPGPKSTFQDSATPFQGSPCNCHSLAGDGIPDLMMHFSSDEVVDVLQLDGVSNGALVELVVSGGLTDGTAFAGRDCIRLVPPGTPPGLLSIQSTVGKRWVEVSPLDETLSGSGFTNFERTYPLTSLVTVTAPVSGGRQVFKHWKLDGVAQPPGIDTVAFSVTGNHELVAIYGPLPPVKK